MNPMHMSARGGRQRADAKQNSQTRKSSTVELPVRPIKRQRVSRIPDVPPCPWGGYRNPNIPTECVLPILGEDGPPATDGDKPVRVLSEFYIMDENTEKALSIASLDGESSERNTSPVAVGLVRPYFDEDDEEDDDDTDVDAGQRDVCMKLTALHRWEMEYTTRDSPVWILTSFGYYRLDRPSPQYKRIFLHFYKQHRIAQLAISFAHRAEAGSLELFRRTNLGYDVHCEQHLKWEDFMEAVPVIHEALSIDILDGYIDIMQRSPLRELFHKTSIHRMKIQWDHEMRPRYEHSIQRLTNKNMDDWVIRSENQAPVTTLPIVAQHAVDHFKGPMKILGTDGASKDRPAPPSYVYEKLCELMGLGAPILDIKVVGRRGRWPTERRYIGSFVSTWKDGRSVEFHVGDTILVRKSVDAAAPARRRYKPRPAIPTDYLWTHFWFAHIIWVDACARSAHVRWFDHAQETILKQFGNPSELFYSVRCDQIPLDAIVDRVAVSFENFKNSSPDDSFHCRFQWNERIGEFTNFSRARRCPNICADGTEPLASDLCHSNRNTQGELRSPAAQQTNCGSFICEGVEYHLNDYILVPSAIPALDEDRPCEVGQIINMRWMEASEESTADEVFITMLMCGRMDALRTDPGFKTSVTDTHHLFLTQEEGWTTLDLVNGKAFVFYDGITLDGRTFPNHFYAKYRYPTRSPTSPHDRICLTPQDIQVCQPCLEEEGKCNAFLPMRQLNVLALCAGVGAMEMGLKMGAGDAISLKYAVEISPSAASTLKENSPDTEVFNTDVNKFFEYSVRLHVDAKKSKPVPEHLRYTIDPTSPQLLPLPPGPNDVDVITAGFPCQPHSSLNMHARPDDTKSGLFLGILSAVAHFQPSFCFLENVRGFLSYKMGSKQTEAGEGQIEGGIAHGGLKLLVASLLNLGYQVRFGLLEALQYGAPQRRNRFFLIAAKSGHILPNFPLPTHTTPLRTLELDKGDKMVQATASLTTDIDGFELNPFKDKAVCPLHRYITVDDAISDLPLFDYKPPDGNAEKERLDARQGVAVALENDDDHSFCGYEGSVHLNPPQSAYQMLARQGGSTVTGHFTQALTDQVITALWDIPLKPEADSRFIQEKNMPWMIGSPMSAHAKSGYRHRYYRRLDGLGYFNTIVTNVSPTAKQSKVLHPNCHRILSLRELARAQGFPDAFKFVTLYGLNVKTMQRQVGNAVPFQVSQALGREFLRALYREHEEEEQDREKKRRKALAEAIVIDDD